MRDLNELPPEARAVWLRQHVLERAFQRWLAGLKARAVSKQLSE